MSEKIEYCINGVSRIQRNIKDTITSHSDEPPNDSDYVSDCIYLYSEIHVLLLYLHDELKRVQDIYSNTKSNEC